MIVVLVILAILAAILVPALLGWIDEAKDKQYILEARNVYMATQAAVDEVYAKTNDVPDVGESIAPGDDMGKRIVELSDSKFTGITIDGYGVNSGEIDEMTITGLEPNGLTAKTLVLGANGWAVS